MKKVFFAVLLLAASLTMLAQGTIQVNRQGSQTTIVDLTWSYLSVMVVDYSDDEEEFLDDGSAKAFKEALINHRNGRPQKKNDKLVVDEKNGYIVFESKFGESLLRVETRCWNETDGKHRLFAYNVSNFSDGQYSPGISDGITYYRYDNSSSSLTQTFEKGLPAGVARLDGYTSYTISPTSDDMIVTYWYDDGKKKLVTMKWDGKTFKESK